MIWRIIYMLTVILPALSEDQCPPLDIITVHNQEECPEERQKECQEDCPLIRQDAKMGHIVNIPDVNHLTDVNLILIRRELLQNGVIVIPGQNLTREQQVVFTSRLGPLLVVPQSFGPNDPEPGLPEIIRVTNYWTNGTWKGRDHGFGYGWHKDGDWDENDYIATMLYAEHVSADSAVTEYLDNCAVYRHLASSVLSTLANSVFAVSVSSIPDIAKGRAEDLAQYPQVRLHEGLHRHPENDRQCAYITETLVTSRDKTRDKTLEERVELERAWRDVTEMSRKYHHKWRNGDIVIWDNLAVMHRAGPKSEGDVQNPGPRMLYRTQAYL